LDHEAVLTNCLGCGNRACCVGASGTCGRYADWNGQGVGAEFEHDAELAQRSESPAFFKRSSSKKKKPKK
jgi:hypothetical protein